MKELPTADRILADVKRRFTYSSYLTKTADPAVSEKRRKRVLDSLPTLCAAPTGLERSGYADYLTGRSKKMKADAIRSLLDTEQKEAASLRSGYADYLSREYEKANKTFHSAVEKLVKENPADAQKRAEELGVSAALAPLAAGEAKTRISTDLFVTAVERIAAAGMGIAAAKNLAKELGLDDELADAAVRTAKAKRRGEETDPVLVCREILEKQKTKG